MADSNPQTDLGEKKDKTCWQCGRSFVTAMEVCPDDGARLIETELDEHDDPLVGTVFDGRFQIKSKLGEGGMGTVYSARRLDFETTVALKLLKVDFARDDGIRKRFMYEARVISNLKHPHAVRLFDFGQTSEGHAYMVMELLSGESLADRLAYRFVSYREVFDIIPPICGVLGEAHIRDVIHRDLKPENIYLLEVDGNEEFPKLLDFGIAKHKREETMTKAGTLWGTPAYMSPEQAQGNAVGPRADIYGIGIMIFELISGNLPFHASTQMGYAVKHINEPVRPLSSIPGLDSVPEELDELLLRMLAKSPEDRPESMDVVASELKRICEEYFDDELLDSVPAEEIDPIGLQRWMQEAPDVSEDDMKAVPGNLNQTVVVDSGEVDSQADGSARESGGLRDVGEMETQAQSAPDQAMARREGYEKTEQIGDVDVDTLRDKTRPEADRAGEEKIPVWVPIAIVGALLIFGLVLLLVDSGDDASPQDEDSPIVIVPDDLHDEDEDRVGTSESPVNGGNAVAVGASRAMGVVFHAYGIIQQGDMDEEFEPDFEFLHQSPDDEELDGEGSDDIDELREALERTF